MAKFKLPAIGFNEGSLLRRTVLYVCTFVVGSVGFVALSSLLVVWAAKSILPSRHAADDADSDKPAEVAAVTPKPNGKSPRPKRGKSSAAPTAEESPVEEIR